jgi:hypothetical protein
MPKNRISTGPEAYQIKVKGIIDLKWSDWFYGFTITHGEGDTQLTGKVPDQAALHGLLAKIRDLGLTLLSVERVENGD